MAKFRRPELTILGGLALFVSLNIAMVGCSDDDPAGPPADVVAPTILAVDPADGSTGVSLNAPVTLTFSEAMDPTTCTETSVKVSDGVTGTVVTDGAQVTFHPSEPLDLLVTYEVSVTTGVCDVAGNALKVPFTSSFTTADQPVAHPGPDQYVSPGSQVTLDATHSSAVSGGTLSFSWTQVAGPQTALLQGSTPSFIAPSGVGTVAYSLVVTEDGIDSEPEVVRIMVMEDPAHAWFVHSTGTDLGAGTIDEPFATIQRAIIAARDENAGGDVYIAGGTYVGSLSLVSNVSLYGSYDPENWYRDDAGIESIIAGDETAIVAFGVSGLTLDGIAVESANAVEPGGSSVGILFDESNGIVLNRSRIRAGNGLGGETGIDGVQGLPGANGSSGSARTGGAGATGAGWAGGRGGNGGPDWYSGSRGSNGAGPGGGGGGSGGAYGGHNGGGGGIGANATPSQDGTGGPEYGAWITGYEPARGEYGERRDGAGGGGGGGGGADGIQNGGGGGGGGAGGQGGQGGAGGSGGGASIAVVLVNGSDVAITNCTLQTGNGGAGNYGGVGGLGAGGGTGGGSGSPQSGLFLKGGYGGTGGTGGHGAIGGYGGGGGGGPVIGILQIQSNSARTNLSFEIGTPGAGGMRPDENGNAGATGESAEYKAMI